VSSTVNLFALAVGVLFGLAVYAIRDRHVVRVVVGLGILSNAVNLMLIEVGFKGQSAPIHGLPGPAADPLVQALILTAIVISFGVTAFALALSYVLVKDEGTTDVESYRRLRG
jgi:multicomponent Na+:H+ antiporter subunit C